MFLVERQVESSVDPGGHRVDRQSAAVAIFLLSRRISRARHVQKDGRNQLVL